MGYNLKKKLKYNKVRYNHKMWTEVKPGIFQYTYKLDGVLHRYFIDTFTGIRSPIEVFDKYWRPKLIREYK